LSGIAVYKLTDEELAALRDAPVVDEVTWYGPRDCQHGEEGGSMKTKENVRLCLWIWNKTHDRWQTGCGYIFKRMADYDNTGTFLPFPFCPYCGAAIRK
jgi:hypothetical protein